MRATTGDTPADTTYHRQSMTEPWPKEWEGTFDLVHARTALPGVGTNPLEDAVEGLVSLVKPGGWTQLVEMEGQGVGLREKLTPMLEASGLVNIDYKITMTPFGALVSDKIRATSEASLFATAMGVSMTTKMLPPISISREDLDAMPPKVIEETNQVG
ncbi:hypothetical protein K458DRAFT_411091 [Lentithecium fluviatile CBS 122367]|uniref:Methyltransferase type 11 domain-containing protein n=1 Tax=Lentithecium fluviatile CBS 122367 TaxID=1168545 RepID=A0A6G1ICG3_9PLEO|nr:hypothetical protein K458DRAFT_411091 [Lentithecium fluviatile CBS 122367]